MNYEEYIKERENLLQKQSALLQRLDTLHDMLSALDRLWDSVWSKEGDPKSALALCSPQTLVAAVRVEALAQQGTFSTASLADLIQQKYSVLWHRSRNRKGPRAAVSYYLSLMRAEGLIRVVTQNQKKTPHIYTAV